MKAVAARMAAIGDAATGEAFTLAGEIVQHVAAALGQQVVPPDEFNCRSHDCNRRMVHFEGRWAHSGIGSGDGWRNAGLCPDMPAATNWFCPLIGRPVLVRQTRLHRQHVDGTVAAAVAPAPVKTPKVVTDWE